MRGSRTNSTLAIIVTVFLLVPTLAQALPVIEPLVFDFEDGLQGWEFHGAVQRVQTRILGGEWAIFGDGAFLPTLISLELDVTDLAVVTLEQFPVVTGDPPPVDFIAFQVSFPDKTFRISLFEGDPTASPGLRVLDLERARETFPLPLEGPARLSIHWLGNPGAIGFIDNITLYPIPEPGAGALVAVGIIGVAALRRFRAEDA